MPDRFDSLMDIGSAKNKGEALPPMMPMDNAGGMTALPFNGAANFGTTGADIMFPGSPRPISPGDSDRCPAEVDYYDGTGGLAAPSAMPYMEDDAL